MIFKNLIRRRGRTLLTILGIAVGVAAIIGLGSLGKGLGAGYDTMLSNSKSDLILSQPNSFDIAYSVVDEAIARDLLAMPEIETVSGMIQGFTQAENIPYFFVFGYPQDSYVLNRFQVLDGMGLQDRRADRVRGTPLILGSAAAESLKKSTNDTLRITGRVFRIIGIFETGNAFEDGGAVLRLEDAQELLGKPRQVSLFYIQLKDYSLRQRLENRVARLYPDLQLSTASELNSQQILDDSFQAFTWVIAGMAILLGGIGMLNANLMSILERTREIGVLRSLGWGKSRIIRMILGESLTVGLVGGILGVGLGFASVMLLERFLSVFGASAETIGVGLVGQSFMVVVLLGLLGGIYPAWRAAGLEPVEALRYEGGSSGENVRRLPFGGMAVQSLWQRSTRTILTLAVISLTVGGVLFLESLVEGFVQDFSFMMSGSDVEIMVRQADIADTSLSAIDERVGDKIAAMPEVESVSGMVLTAISLPEANSFFIIQGYEPGGFAGRRFNVVEGRWLNGNRQLVLGRMMAESLKKQVGDTIELAGSRFKIVGILESGIGWEEMGGVISLRDAQNFVGRPRKVTLYMVNLFQPATAQAVAEQINRENQDIYAALSGEFVDEMPDMQAMDAMFLAISFLTIIVGGLGVMNTMLMAVMERTREIGVLRALGWRRSKILGMIMKESLLLGVLGGITGVMIALLLGSLFKQLPVYGISLTVVWRWDLFLRSLLVSLLLGVSGGLYPALRATLLTPVEALRYE